MTIFGIDPGYDRLGWAIVQAVGSGQKVVDIVDYGCIQTRKSAKLSQRYLFAAKELEAVIKKHQPSVLAIESLFFSKNQKTALQVSEMRGVVLVTCLKSGLEIFEYAPNTIKLAVTGNGHADKKAMEKMLRLELGLAKEKIIDDAVDAIGIAYTYFLSEY